MTMRFRRMGVALLAAALAGAGCYATTTATVTSDPYGGPDLVYAAPGVQVIADYDEPIFYNDGFYWRYYGGTWYRSSYWTGGWVYAAPPVAVLRINRPASYAHYRPQGWAPRPARAAPAPGWRGAPGPAPAQQGWRGQPAPAQAQQGWRGQPAQQPAQPQQGWRGQPAQAAPRPAGPPPQAAPPKTNNNSGWRRPRH
jgi:hypothetical protein